MFRRKSMFILYALVFAAFTNLSAFTVERYDIPLMPILYVLATGVLLLNIFLSESYSLESYRDPRVYAVIFFFLIYLTVGSINANVDNALKYEIYLLLTGFFIFNLIPWYVRKQEEIDGILLTIVLCGPLLAIQGGYKYFMDISTAAVEINSIRATGWWDNPNVFAFVLNLTYLVSFYFTDKEQRALRWISCLTQFSAAFGVFLSLSRGGILMWIFITLMNWRSIWNRRKTYLGTIIGLAAILSMMIFTKTLTLETLQNVNVERLLWNSDKNLDDFSNGRFEAALGGLAIFAQHPVLGVGFGNLLDYAELTNHLKLYSHNLYIDILAVSGFLPLICYVLMLEYLLFSVLPDIRKKVDVAKVLAMFIIVLSGMGFFSHTLLYMKPVWVLLALFPVYKAVGR